MLTNAHADVRFLLGPYRAWVESSVSEMADSCLTDDQYTMLCMGPRLVWRLGRFLLRVDIALRRLGYGDEIDATIAMLRDLAAKDETREAVRVFKEHWQERARSEATGLAEEASDTLSTSS